MFLRLFFAVILLSASLMVKAGSNDPLFINLTTDEITRMNMAINFGKHHFANDHPLTIFLNDKATILAVKAGGSKYADQQKDLAEVIAKGGLVIVCPPCIRQAGYSESDLLPGIKIGGPKVTGDALFKDGTKTMSW